jgi:hypothetical protein
MSDERVSISEITCPTCHKAGCAGVCKVCHRHLPRLAEGGSCICASHVPVPVGEMAEIADQPTELRRHFKPQDIENLVREAHKHYYNRDPAALERMVRGLFS